MKLPTRLVFSLVTVHMSVKPKNVRSYGLGRQH